MALGFTLRPISRSDAGKRVIGLIGAGVYVWILATGYWSDDGVWLDHEVWSDG